jgi:asparaginyl-tRNA synthetase
MSDKRSVAEARREASIGQEARVQGWVRTRRDSKSGFSFIEINDGSCQGNLQVIAQASLSNYEDQIKSLSPGCSISVEGSIQKSGGQGQTTEIVARKIDVFGWADPEAYPLQKKRHTFEKLREWAHLRPRTNTFGAIARLRNIVCFSIHQFFQEHGFLYVHMPIITASDAEGAGAMFQVTTLNLEQLAQKKLDRVDYKFDFFQRPAFLTVSGQLEAETYACALGKVYTFGPTFRAENSNTSRHLSEFWMIEPEMAFYELNDNMDLAESFLKRIFRDVMTQGEDEVRFLQKNAEPDQSTEQPLLENLRRIVESEFIRLPYTQAIEILTTSGQKFDFPVKWGVDLQSEHERYLTETHFQSPVILYDYPAEIKSFYMYQNDDGKTVRAMDVLVPGVGEIIGGSQREHRLENLRAAMAKKGLDERLYWWYLDLRRFGTVPHSGFGLGLERVVQFVSGMGNIRDVIPFPRTPGNAEF